MKIIEQRLKLLRENLGISQNKLAKEIGIAQASVNRYEAGAISPSVETLLWYADRFDVSLDYIFGRTDNPQGKLYEYQPKIIEEDDDMKKFIDMCFDPKSPANARFKQALLQMLQENKE